MSRIPIRDPLKPVVERAVELSRQPDAVERTSGSSRFVSTHEDMATIPDEDGYTVHVMLWGVDEWDDPSAHWADAVTF